MSEVQIASMACARKKKAFRILNAIDKMQLAIFVLLLLIYIVTEGFLNDLRAKSFSNFNGNKSFGVSSAIDPAQPLYLQGDELIYDSRREKVTARGNVEITFNNYILTADQIVYDQSANTLSASGNVVLRDPKGDITRTERITLTDDFRDGFIQSLSIIGRDQSRITARRAVRRDGRVTEFELGKFTPCVHDPGKPPLWCITADRIIHDADAATITYLDTTFDIMGVPVVYLPFFQHPDPSVKRRSGFLLPRFSSSEDLGFTLETPYYFAFSRSYDLTFNPLYTARQGMLWRGVWRHKLAFGNIRGQYYIKFAGIDQSYEDLPNNDSNLDGWRGSFETRSEFSLSSWWNFGWDVTIESDDTFRRFYKMDNILQTDRVNSIHFTGLSDRNFFQVKGYHFGGLLLSDSDASESRVHPTVDWNYIVGAPVFGGELSWTVNALSMSRNLAFNDINGQYFNTDTSSQRLIGSMRWRRRFIDPFGITYTPSVNLRGGILNYKNAVDPTSNTLIDQETVTRGVMSASLLASYPWLAHSQSTSHVIEPIGQIIGRTSDVRQIDLPNEDARSIVFNDTNLFELNKTSGFDRVETGTRVNLGLQYTFQSNSGGYARLLAGQSFHLSGKNIYEYNTGNEPSVNVESASKILTENNGLEDRTSDYVLGAYLAPSQTFSLIGQGRFDDKELSLRRADVTARFLYGPTAITSTYTYTASDPLDLSVEDQQELLGTAILQLADHWRFLGSLRYDIDESSFRSHDIALQYSDDCFILTTKYTETNTNNKDIISDRTIMLYFALKHLGEFKYRTDALDHLLVENQDQ
ncbi:MAG: LPS-assembly protein LptD [Hyphomicrobiaceae bacterium]|nr:LPS-assembly protein LptD [Hyphomicrobiaceae bacterium]